MLSHACLLLFALASARSSMIWNDPALLRLSATMVERIGSDEELERAAFITRDGAALKLVHWRWQAKRHSATWLGPMPEGVVAVIHTHPRRMPRPSRQDAATARRLGLPVFVATHGSLSMVDVEGRVCVAGEVPWTWPRRDVTVARWDRCTSASESAVS